MQAFEPRNGCGIGMEFTYYKKLSPMVGAVLALACVETIVLHILAMAFLGGKVAVVISILDSALVFILARMIHDFRLRPIIVDDDIVVMRTGRKLSFPIALCDIKGFRKTWNADDLKAPGVLNMALVVWLNTMFELETPIVRRGRKITTIAHCLDRPEAFQQTLGQLRGDLAQTRSVG
ncbi:hypothetical protein [Sphingomonas sp.]|uniref:hypothetical protein n=1 Tax=Sphingomonas sp. TaxID=28214 RepID=UPI0028B00535|nr:hypothetical protein [Sphingomonas sp.]